MEETIVVVHYCSRCGLLLLLEWICFWQFPLKDIEINLYPELSLWNNLTSFKTTNKCCISGLWLDFCNRWQQIKLIIPIINEIFHIFFSIFVTSNNRAKMSFPFDGYIHVSVSHWIRFSLHLIYLLLLSSMILKLLGSNHTLGQELLVFPSSL